MHRDPIDDLQGLVTGLWSQSGLKTFIYVHRSSPGDGTPHVESHDGLYDIIFSERGTEWRRMSRMTRTEAARWFVFWSAQDHAIETESRERRAPNWILRLLRKPADDGYSRWNWMAPCIALMERISPDFGIWTAQHYAETLETSPLSASERRNARFPLSIDCGDIPIR